MSEYHHLAENSPAALVLVRLNGTIIAANNAACRLLGLYRQQMEQLTVDQWLARPIERTRDALAHIRASSGTYIDVTLRHGEGFEFSAQLSSRVFEHPAHGRVASIVLRFNAALATSGDEDADVAQVALDHIDEAAVLLDSNTRIRALNPAYTRITGYDEAAALGQSLELGAARRGADSWDGLIEAMSPGERWTGEVQNRRRNGELYPAYVKITALAPSEDEAAAQFVVVFRDLSADKAYEARIEYLAHYDTLTGLANRTLIEKRAELARIAVARDGRHLALLFLDLDGFKAVNDSLGHATGDELLRHVADRLRSAVSKTDIVARQGGDEFVILLDSISKPEDAAYVAARIQETLRVPLTLNDQTVFTTASIGISCYPDDSQDLTTLLRNADMAMYRAKRQGHGRYVFYRPEMDANAHWMLQLRNNLHRALDRDELHVYYQPFVDVDSGTVTGIEALLRWQNDELGMVSPVDFIPIAEETGLIIEIGQWVLRAACRELQRLHARGYDHLRVAVNLSARQFRQTDLVAQIADVLAETGLASRYLELEITETVLMEQAGATLDTLHGLHELGVAVALDDFGTGYSSLSYLRRFPITYLKVDKSFVDGIPGEKGDLTITRTIVAMARSLGIRVTAEGVETAAQGKWLRHWNCEEAQGYLYSLPLAADDLEWLLCNHDMLPVSGEIGTLADNQSSVLEE
ncbi:Sensor diguanylate cyclase-phosphodiesterase PAS domain-containing protein [Salinisphaera shabanensis E1L3A]|uniref:cyclic-guanylate-specific phosphodiesterase n=1 Tax=Salinisphaera shabanensis E1L3A TaxID=1033802 RepID=U2FV44_9GAMM|nr:bifunctional diguanylate cyclase/phosphodiesterase [Salinisphaera shabanensis]ERJ19794.1 Sensor diguanylate cyclase-phosphodiesterase PAS domain-containing protein [Salinisphaera shabanensis E1L3A]